MVVSGAPTITKFHAQYICNMGLDMVKTVSELRDPSTDDSIEIRVGKWLYYKNSCTADKTRRCGPDQMDYGHD